MALPLPIDPAPASVESLIRALPAKDRARLEWFPEEFRAKVVRPLLEKGGQELSLQLLAELAVPAAALLSRLGSSMGQLLVGDPSMVSLLTDPNLMRLDPEVIERIAASNPKAARDLAAAVDWLRAIIDALLREYRNSVAHGFDEDIEFELDEASLREELDGPLGYFVRGTLLTSATTDVALTSAELPPALGSWCSLALLEIQAAANVLRAQGLQIPTALRSHDAPSVLRSGLLPPGLLERIIGQFNPQEVWLFGSRAAGTHSPTSDYDVFVILDDNTDVERITSWARVAPLRRACVDLIAVSKAEFEESKGIRGTLSNVVVEEGRCLYER